MAYLLQENTSVNSNGGQHDCCYRVDESEENFVAKSCARMVCVVDKSQRLHINTLRTDARPGD